MKWMNEKAKKMKIAIELNNFNFHLIMLLQIFALIEWSQFDACKKTVTRDKEQKMQAKSLENHSICFYYHGFFGDP